MTDIVQEDGGQLETAVYECWAEYMEDPQSPIVDTVYILASQ